MKGKWGSLLATASSQGWPTLGELSFFRALARSSLLRDWFPCAGSVLSPAQTLRGRPQTTSTRLYAGALIPSAQRLVWAAKQALGKAALGALFA